jgi:hypothetical protein
MSQITNEYYSDDKNHVIKPNCKPIYKKEPEPSLQLTNKKFELQKRTKDKKIDYLEELRKFALIYNPKYGDDLYPLEVLGVYHIVLNDFSGWWDFTSYGNPENFIDNQIIEWANKTDLQTFAIKMQKVIESDELIRKAFELRLNYAWLLEKNKDTITINTKRARCLIFNDNLDRENNYINEEELDRLADAFYIKKDKIDEKITGTPKEIRFRIKQMMDSAGIELNEDINSVYHELKKFNSKYYEEGLIGRIAYLIFINETHQKRICK